MIQAVRDSIFSLLSFSHTVATPANLSLLFNRLCQGIDEDKKDKSESKENTLNALLNGYSEESFSLYKAAFERWKRIVETMAQEKDALCFEMEVRAPLVVGKGDQNVHEFGITLQPTWGTPVIPGAAIKGVLSSFAHEKGDGHWQKDCQSSFKGEYALIMFGGTNQKGEASAGCLDFLDAWWVPTGRTPFGKDIITVHNRDYHQGKDVFPDGTCDPIPNKFVVIQPGQKFLFTICGDLSWRKLAKEILKDATREKKGFGAKTRLGYGRLSYLETTEDIVASLPDSSDQELKQRFRYNRENDSVMEKLKALLATRECNQDTLEMFTALLPEKSLMFRLTHCENWDHLKSLLGTKESEELLKDTDVGKALFQTADRLRKKAKKWKPERDTQIAKWLKPSGLNWEIKKTGGGPTTCKS